MACYQHVQISMQEKEDRLSRLLNATKDSLMAGGPPVENQQVFDYVWNQLSSESKRRDVKENIFRWKTWFSAYCDAVMALKILEEQDQIDENRQPDHQKDVESE